MATVSRATSREAGVDPFQSELAAFRYSTLNQEIVDSIMMFLGGTYCLIAAHVAIKSSTNVKHEEQSGKELGQLEHEGHLQHDLNVNGEEEQKQARAALVDENNKRDEVENEQDLEGSTSFNQVDDQRKKRVKVIMDQVNEAAIFARVVDVRDDSTGAPFLIQQSSIHNKVEIIQMNKECKNMFGDQFINQPDIVNLQVFK